MIRLERNLFETNPLGNDEEMVEICLLSGFGYLSPNHDSFTQIHYFNYNFPAQCTIFKWWSFDEDKSFGGGSDCALPQISVLITPSNIHPFPSFKLINWFIIGYYGMPLGHCPKDKVLCMTWSSMFVHHMTLLRLNSAFPH